MHRNALAVALLAAALAACNSSTGPGSGDGYAGYIYASNNASTGNGIIMLGRRADGGVAELAGSPVLTGAMGDAADGDFDTQGGLRIVGDYLLAVNAGANPVNGSISVFRIDRSTGGLTRIDQDPATAAVDNMDSRGERAVSIAASTVGGTTWVLVGNQLANPHYEMSPAVAVGTVVTSNARNLAVFSFDQTTGRLAFSRIGATYADGSAGGPTTVSFSGDGSRVAVSTWGVAHIMTPDADLTLQKPGRLYVYSFAAGTLTQTGVFQETGVSGNIGLSWSPDARYIYLTNFNLHSSKESNSVTVHDGVTAAKVQNFATAERNDEACWTWVSLDAKHLFTASFTSNAVSTFDIGSDGRLSTSLTPNYVTRRGAPMADTKEMYQSPDGYLYVEGAFKSHSISVFRIGTNGSLTELTGSPYAVPSSVGKTEMQHAYIGLTGFDK